MFAGAFSLLMTQEELEQIQTVCHEWLRQSGTAKESRMTIPAGGALARPVALEVRSLLTFDNVMILSAVDAETGVCYSKFITPPGESGEFVDTPLDMINSSSTSPSHDQPAALRATQRRYQDAMERLAETQQRPANEGVPAANETEAWWIEKENSHADEEPKFLLYTNGELLGYSLLERIRADGERSGRFHPNENYFEYSAIFENLPEAENDCLEANVQEAYGILQAGNDEYRKRFNELSAQADALKLYVLDEDGRNLEAAEVRLEDLARYYNDQTERWLYLTLGQTTKDETDR